MKQEIATLWVTALRSGKYEQTTEFLNIDGAMCCLGVLCDLHAQATGDIWDSGTYHGEDSRLPDDVAEWAGMNFSPESGDAGRLATPVTMTTAEGDEAFQHLAMLNDHGITFAEIADVIEQQQEAL